MIKLGLIGGGYWGKNLIRDFNCIGVLDTICDVDIELLNKYKEMYPNINVTTKWTDILENKDINAVCISLPADLHYKFCMQALLADKDVYVEKPITTNVSDSIELVELAKKMNKILMVGHILHYHPSIQRMKRIVKDGDIGRIKSIV